MPSNLSLQSVIDYVTTQVRGANLTDVLGTQNEPALSICNDVYQEVLQKPLTWRFNKANTANTGKGILPWTTQAYQQDYGLTNATAEVSGVGIMHIQTVANGGFVVSSGTATVITLSPCVFSVGQTVTFFNVGQFSASTNEFVADTSGNINTSFTILTIASATSFTFACSATDGTYGAPGINDIGWIERCVLQDYLNTSTVKPVHSIEVTMNLEVESIVQPPFKISYQWSVTDTTNAANQLVPSIIAYFRFWPVPSQQIWSAIVDYQKKPQTFTALTDTWGVWPDELIFVIRQGVKTWALDFVEDPRAISEYQVFEKKLNQVREIRDQERPSQTMFPDRPLMFGG